jgi:hypothetical protein
LPITLAQVLQQQVKHLCMRTMNALIGGLVGSVTTTWLHQYLRTKYTDAPRMDKLGEETLNETITRTGHEPLRGDTLHITTLTGDLLGNAAYYALAGAGSRKTTVEKGLLLGLAAGAGAVFIPQVSRSMDETYSNKTTRTQLLTLAIYLAGGLAAGVVISCANKIARQ